MFCFVLIQEYVELNFNSHSIQTTGPFIPDWNNLVKNGGKAGFLSGRLQLATFLYQWK